MKWSWLILRFCPEFVGKGWVKPASRPRVEHGTSGTRRGFLIIQTWPSVPTFCFMRTSNFTFQALFPNYMWAPCCFLVCTCPSEHNKCPVNKRNLKTFRIEHPHRKVFDKIKFFPKFSKELCDFAWRLTYTKHGPDKKSFWWHDHYAVWIFLYDIFFVIIITTQ
jgi:hypothetical protein